MYVELFSTRYVTQFVQVCKCHLALLTTLILGTQGFITTGEIYTFYYSSALLSQKLIHVKKEDTLLNHLNNCYSELYKDNRIDGFYLITNDVSVHHTNFTFRTNPETLMLLYRFIRV